MSEPVQKENCEVMMGAIKDQITNNKARLDKHSDQIDDLFHIVDRLSAIEEQNNRLLEIALEREEVGCTPVHTTEAKVWQQPWFKYIVITGCIVVIMVIGAAVGNNVLDKYIEAMRIVEGGIQ